MSASTAGTMGSFHAMCNGGTAFKTSYCNKIIFTSQLLYNSILIYFIFTLNILTHSTNDSICLSATGEGILSVVVGAYVACMCVRIASIELPEHLASFSKPGNHMLIGLEKTEWKKTSAQKEKYQITEEIG